MRQMRSFPLVVAGLGLSLCLLLGLLLSCSSSAKETAEQAPSNFEPGTFPVGITSFTFVDESRPTPANASQPGLPSRTLQVRVWYPAVAPNTESIQDDDFASIPDPTPLFDAPPATGSGPFPLIVFGHGLGAAPAEYGDLLATWAGAGYVVAAPAFPLNSENSPGLADPGDVVNQSGDVSAVITHAISLSSSADGRALAGMIDGERVGVAGHSNGGITIAGLIGQACCVDERVDAAIIIAGTSQLLPGKTFDWSRTPPLLIVHGENDTVIPYDEGARIFNSARSPKGLFTLIDSDHNSYLFSDSRAFPITAKATLDFFNGYVKSDAAAIAALADDQEPGVASMTFVGDPSQSATVERTLPKMPSRAATVTPLTGLRDGQMVRVEWSGFLPDHVVTVAQCSDGAREGSASCDLVTGKVLRYDPDGWGSLELEIVVGKVGNGVCDADHTDCLVIVNDAALLDEDANFRFPLTFAR